MKYFKNFNRNVSITRRIAFGFIFVLIGMIVAGLAGVFSLGIARNNFVRYRQLNDRMVSIVEIDNAVAELQRNISNYTYTGHKSIIFQVEKIVSELDNSLLEVRSLLISEKEKELAKEMKINLDNYVKTFNLAVAEQTIKDQLVRKKIPQLLQTLAKTNLQTKIIEIELYIYRYLKDPSRPSYKTVDNKIAKILSSPVSSRQLDSLKSLKSLFLRATQATRSYLYLVNVVMAGNAYEFKHISKEIKALIIGQSMPIKNEIEFETKATQQMTVAFLVFFILLGSFFSWLIATGISQPLKTITETFEKLSGGYKKVKIPEQDRSDEIGVLSKAADVFRKNNEKLAGSHDELKQFSYRTSHDLKAPLITSKRLSEYIYSDIESGDLEEAKKNSLKITKQMQNLEELIVDILDLAKADLKEDDSKIIDFEEVFSTARERLSWLLESSQCQLNLKSEVKSNIIGDKVRFSQVLENLVSNGIKYKDASKKDCFVNANFYEDDKSLFISVEDNGLGIPSEKIGDIFKMFQRFHPKTASGSGLGLSLVKKHIDFMNGTIEVKSSDQGTTFNIIIPKKGRTL